MKSGMEVVTHKLGRDSHEPHGGYQQNETNPRIYFRLCLFELLLHAQHLLWDVRMMRGHVFVTRWIVEVETGTNIAANQRRRQDGSGGCLGNNRGTHDDEDDGKAAADAQKEISESVRWSRLDFGAIIVIEINGREE